MARKAITTTNDPKAKARSERKARSKTRLKGIAGKTFEELSPKEKDRLLKVLLIRNGLVADSEDEG